MRLLQGRFSGFILTAFVVCGCSDAWAAPAVIGGEPIALESDARVAPDAPPRAVGAVLTNDNKIDSLVSGYQWPLTTITYSFYEDDVFHGAYYGAETNVHEVSEAVKNNVRNILAWYASVIPITFVEVGETLSSVGLIRIMDSDSPGYAYAYYPFGSSAFSLGGDVHLRSSYDRLGDTNGFQHPPGQHGYVSIIHELGHAMGLKHPHDDSPNLPVNEDTHTNTVMSYQFYGNSPGTLMAYDIKTLQTLYGVRAAHASEDTYLFTRQALDQYSVGGAVSLDPSNPTKQTIWDSGGYNTIDLSGISPHASGYRLDLKPMGWLTTVNGYQTTYYTVGTSVGRDVSIRRVINSGGNDLIYANSSANVFGGYTAGRAVGSDTIYDADDQDVVDLSAYDPSGVSQSAVGNDHLIVLGGNGSITLKNYYLSASRPTISFTAGTPSMSIEDVTIAEGNSGSTVANFSLSLNSPAAGPITVNYATESGSAAAGSDFVAASGTISFAAGEMSKTIAVTISGDGDAEPNETFLVRLSGATGTVTVADDSAIGTITNDDVPNVAPLAMFTTYTTSLAPPSTIQFSATGSSDSDGSIVSYAWNFGDGSSATGVSVEHVFAEEGTYGVTLTVTDDDGATASLTNTLTISATANVSPIAAAAATVVQAENPRRLQFSSAGSEDPDGAIVAYDWDFGDGEVSAEANPIHMYLSGGIYAVSLTVVDNRGDVGSTSFELTVSSGSSSAISVAQISTAASSRSGLVSLKATVHVINGLGFSVPNARVIARFSGAVRGDVEGRTNSAGRVVFVSPGSRRGGTGKITIRSVSKSGFNYNRALNVQTSAALDLPTPRRRR